MALKTLYKPIFTASILNLLLFIVFALFATPLYDTNEDVFIAYTLGGGFGNAPSELLHYNNGMHPLPGLLIKKLFHLTNTINWYTCILYLCHYLACTVISYAMLLYTSRWRGIMAYLVLFIVFECQLLLSLSFTNTCILLSMAGFILWVLYGRTGQRRYLVTGIIFIIIASLFRVHTILPVAGIMLPLLVYPFSRKKGANLGLSLTIVLIGIIALHQFHLHWYTSHIPGWSQEESYRQHIYNFYNHHQLYYPAPGEAWYTERHLIAMGHPLDTQFLSTEKLSRMYQDLGGMPLQQKPATSGGVIWQWVNNRLYLLTLFLFIVQAALYRKHWALVVITTILMLAGLTFLLCFFKLSDYLVITSFFMVCILSYLLPPQESPIRYSLYGLLHRALLAGLLCWGFVRAFKVSHKNVRDNPLFQKAQAAMAAHPGKLFIVAGGQFPLQKFCAWSVPIRFPLMNFINNEFFLHNLQGPVLKRFGSNSIREVPFNHNIVFWGKPVDVLNEYFQQTGHKPVTIVPADSALGLEQAYRIIYQ